MLEIVLGIAYIFLFKNKERISLHFWNYGKTFRELCHAASGEMRYFNFENKMSFNDNFARFFVTRKSFWMRAERSLWLAFHVDPESIFEARKSC